MLFFFGFLDSLETVEAVEPRKKFSEMYTDRVSSMASLNELESESTISRMREVTGISAPAESVGDGQLQLSMTRSTV